MTYSSENVLYQTRNRPNMGPVWGDIKKRNGDDFEKVNRFKASLKRRDPAAQPVTTKLTKREILNPSDPYLQQWNNAFVVCCVLAVSLDPLFFYIPLIDSKRNCLDLDKKLGITVCVLRSIFDLFYIVHIIFQFRTGFIDPSSRVFGRRQLVNDALLIAKRYLYSYFTIDILSVLPVPQVFLLLIAPKLKDLTSFFAGEILKYVICIQFIPRFFRIYPLYKEVTVSSGIFAERAWSGLAIYLILYMLAIHVCGASWYLFAIERMNMCWREACKDQFRDCNDLYSSKTNTDNSYLNNFCGLRMKDDVHAKSPGFKFGIYVDAFRSGIVETRNFPKKFFYCFWWGLRNLSSLGQNLKTSTYIGEIGFAVFGLLTFSLLIGSIQKYLQFTTVRDVEIRVRRRDAEQWMSHRMLPKNLRERVRRHEQYKLQETRGFDEDRLVRGLPKDLRRDIKRHIFLDVLSRVPMFEKMDKNLLDALCDRLKPVWYTEKSYMLREGDPVDEMLFIVRGNSVTITSNGGKTGYFISLELNAGDFCGEELLPWALDPNSLPYLPASAATVQALTEVEAFSLTAEDLKSVVFQFPRLRSKQLTHAFKFYSLVWRTWAARVVQAAWRRYWKRNLEKKSLIKEEERLQLALA